MQAYPHYLIDFARKFRKEQTRSEAILWQYLRNRKHHGLKFKRQHRIGNFIVDFYCRELKLVVELEGGVHEIPDQQEYDAVRFEELQNRGLRILRFKNEEVLNNPDAVLKQITTLTPLPLSQFGRGEQGERVIGNDP